MIGTYADYGGNSVLDYFRPITNETRNHENFAVARYQMGRYFCGEGVAIIDLLLQADKEMQTFYEQAKFDYCDAMFCEQATAYMTGILTHLREEMLPDTDRLKLQFRLVGNHTINTPEVVAGNHHVILVMLQNANADESHYLTLAFVKSPPEA